MATAITTSPCDGYQDNQPWQQDLKWLWWQPTTTRGLSEVSMARVPGNVSMMVATKATPSAGYHGHSPWQSISMSGCHGVGHQVCLADACHGNIAAPEFHVTSPYQLVLVLVSMATEHHDCFKPCLPWHHTREGVLN